MGLIKKARSVFDFARDQRRITKMNNYRYNTAYTPKYFTPRELLPQDIESDNWMYVFDHRLLRSLDAIREEFGAIIVNNYPLTGAFKGELQYRGWRPPGCDVGAEFSQHRFGRGLDFNFMTVKPSTSNLVRFIANNTDITYFLIYDNFFHIDTRNAKDFNWQIV